MGDHKTKKKTKTNEESKKQTMGDHKTQKKTETNEESDERGWSQLPVELLVKIFSYLLPEPQGKNVNLLCKDSAT